MWFQVEFKKQEMIHQLEKFLSHLGWSDLLEL